MVQIFLLHEAQDRRAVFIVVTVGGVSVTLYFSTITRENTVIGHTSKNLVVTLVLEYPGVHLVFR